MNELKHSVLLAAAFGLTASIQAGAFYIDRFDDPPGGVEWAGPLGPGNSVKSFATGAFGGFTTFWGIAENETMSVNLHGDGVGRFRSGADDLNAGLLYSGDFLDPAGGLSRAMDGRLTFKFDYTVTSSTQFEVNVFSNGREGYGASAYWHTIVGPGSGRLETAPLQDWANHVDLLDIDEIQLIWSNASLASGGFSVTVDNFVHGSPEGYQDNVPEPASTALVFALGLAGLAAWRRCRA